MISGKYTPGDFDINLSAEGATIVVAPVSGSNPSYSQTYEAVDTGTLVWTQAAGQLPADEKLHSDLHVYRNGVRMEYAAEFTITRNTGVEQSTIQDLFPFIGSNYVVIANVPL